MTIQSMLETIAARYPAPAELEPLQWVEPRPRCHNCRGYEVMDYGELCEHCTLDNQRGYSVMYKMGRLANGAALDGGTIYHAVKNTGDYGIGSAVCGTKTGRRSAGWMRQVNQPVTCKACLKKVQRG
jgi:hypothetical protein